MRMTESKESIRMVKSQTASNVAFYQKRGFRVVSDGLVPNQEIKIWTMLRQAQR